MGCRLTRAFSNGQLFSDAPIELAELRMIAQTVHESAMCPYPEELGFLPTEAPPGLGDLDGGSATIVGDGGR